MRLAIFFAAGLAFVAGAALAQQERREVAAHVHGRSVLRIAIEGAQIAMDFDAPGLDVVGFEHTPRTAEETKAVDDAKATLAQPLALFDFGRDAGCVVKSAMVDFLIEEHHDAQDQAHADTTAAAAGGTDQPEAITNHTGFEGSYELACANTAAIRELKLGFLERFANAMVVEVQLVTPKGQTTFDVARPATSGSLAGLI